MNSERNWHQNTTHNGKEWISPDLDGLNGGMRKRWRREKDVGSTINREILDAELNYIKD